MLEGVLIELALIVEGLIIKFSTEDKTCFNTAPRRHMPNEKYRMGISVGSSTLRCNYCCITIIQLRNRI